MVSKFDKNFNLPVNATYDGPLNTVSNAPDQDTFRCQITGLPKAIQPQIRLDVYHNGSSIQDNNVPHIYDMVTPNQPTALTTFRTNQYVRLVSNAWDDSGLSHQTIRVSLGDIVRGAVLIDGQNVGQIELPVARPSYENNINSIRTTRVVLHFINPTPDPNLPPNPNAPSANEIHPDAILANLCDSS